jgi:predicted  nucleic acid-binding Zn-ribbon protein
MDSTYMTYGTVLTYSESVYTHISKRDDLSCINLAGVIDMTDTSLTNTVRNDFLKQYISRKYLELSGVLPIVKNTMKFRIYYTIRDIYGGTIQQNHCDTNVTDSHFHFTDIRDRYVQSAKGLVIDNIPAITYQGLYNITIDRVDLIMGYIDTKEHLVDAMNPFYQFTDNNQKIMLQSETIKNTPADNELVVATCDVNKSFDYQANVTNRLRFTFTAFTSLPIACGDTMGIWNALNEPTDAVIAQLRNEVTALEDEVTALHARDDAQQTEIDELKGQVTLNTNNIAALTARVATLEAANTNKDRIITEILERLEALERIPLALVAYKEGQQFIRSQITWLAYGNLYQATRDFVASGSFMQDVGLGYLVPVIKEASPYDALLERVADIETTANDASSDAHEAVELVSGMSNVVEGHSSSIATLTTDVSGLAESVGTVSTSVSAHSETLTNHETRITALENNE